MFSQIIFSKRFKKIIKNVTDFFAMFNIKLNNKLNNFKIKSNKTST